MSLKDSSSSTGPIPWRKAAAVLIGLSALFPVATWIAWSPFPYGTELLNLVGIGPILLGGLAILSLPAGLVLMLFPPGRRWGIRITLFSIVWVVGAVAGLWLSLPIERAARLKLANHAVSLVQAIHSYEEKEGQAPSRLNKLVPAYLPTIPSTGIGSHPEFWYRRAEGTNFVMGDRWALRVLPPQVGIGFDQMFYIPSREYPQRGYGGVIERVGDWAYVHE